MYKQKVGRFSYGVLIALGLAVSGCSSMSFNYDSRLCSQAQIDDYLMKARKMQETDPEAAQELYQKACDCQGRKKCPEAVK